MRVTILATTTLCSTACFADADYFNERRAVHLCKANKDCADEAVFTPQVADCEDAEAARFDQCPMLCDYDPEAARACMRAIRPIKRECRVDEHDPDIRACAEVYTHCELPEDSEEDCDATPIEDRVVQGCSVTAGANAFGLLVFPFLWRRRGARLTASTSRATTVAVAPQQ